MRQYNSNKIETKWQKRWEKNTDLYQAHDKSKKRKFYCLCMFPYPSGDGLHVGHVESYTATDIYSRFKRMQGFNVLYPMGWDAFGLPAENYAIKTGIHPAKTTASNISRFKKQAKSIGLSYDWEREINSSDPDYYKWTQWFFLFLYKRGLAYRAKAKANWCPKCQTTIANEQVVNGRCERCETEVIQKELEQWFFRTTYYADQLLKDLDSVDWPDSIKETQRNWIGKSEGMEVIFEVKSFSKKDEERLLKGELNNLELSTYLKSIPKVAEIKVFTTRPDTLFGATYLAVAPDGKIISDISKYVRNKVKLRAYQINTSKKNELERTELNRKKTGIRLEGLLAINPVNGCPVPLWAADYVMGDYGSGAVMAVPSHDLRDFEFSFQHGLPVKRVIYQTKKYLAFLDLSFVEDPKKLYTELYRKYPLENLSISKKGFQIDKSKEEINKDIYGIIVEISDENELSDYINLVQGHLKKDFWSEIVGGKYLEFVFKEEILKDDSDTNKQQIKKKIKKGFSKLSRRKKFDPRVALLGKIINQDNFSADFVPWTIPAGSIRELVCYAGKDGSIFNSAFLEGMSVERGYEKISHWLNEKMIGKRMVNYRLRDWLISRQRYWGAPIPIVYCPVCGTVPVPEKNLPVKLPSKVEFIPTGESPLKKLPSFYETKCPKCSGKATREVDTMDTFVCSSWYYFRYTDNHNNREFASQEKIRRYLPVDLYVGGAEHAVLHLLYSRFFTKTLKDAGYIDFSEPFLKLRNQGIILGPDHNKMSKSKGNVISPDDIIKEFGADSLRLYEMFMGPLTEMKPWDSKSIVGVRRFLEKVWGLQEKIPNPKFQIPTTDTRLKRLLHQTIRKVTDDIESLSFNTAISQMMILVNAWKEVDYIVKTNFETFITLLSPFAPHLAEEIWENLGNNTSIFLEDWPTANPEFLKIDEVRIAIQINGKKRAIITFGPDATEEEVRKKVLGMKKIQGYLKGKMLRKWIYVPGKIVNIVIG